jgi:hypothetical protein
MNKYLRHPWESALVLSNAHVTLAVNPWIGRIVWFGRSDGPNLLWMNSPEGVTRDKPAGAWYNWGGDKVWLGPQPHWPAMLGRSWPPDQATDLWPWAVNHADDRRLVMTSPVSRFTLAQVVREITLDKEQPRVRIRHTVRRATTPPDPKNLPSASAVQEPMQIWTVTQIKLPEYVLLDVQPNHPAAPQAFHPMVPKAIPVQATPLVLAQGRLVRAASWSGEPVKLGTIGRWLAGVFEQDILVECSRPRPNGKYPERSNLQWFVCQEYGELETLTALEPVTPGKELEDEIEWHLLRRPLGKNPEQLRDDIERIVPPV